jgi:hypothetical protein
MNEDCFQLSDFSITQNFYQCIDGQPYLLSCPLGQHFDESRQTCDRPENVNCIVTPMPPPTTPRPPSPSCENVENFQFIRSPTNCFEYFQCIDNDPFLLSCPRGLYFNERIQTCDYPGNVDCVTTSPGPTSTTTEPLGVSCENQSDGHSLPHFSSCALYYQCFNEIGLYFC